MDFRNVPNTNNYTAEPVDGSGGISSGTISPNAYVAATLQEEEPKQKNVTKWVLIGVVVLFTLLSIGSSAFFFYANSQQAAASENNFEDLIVVVTNPVNSPIPTPTYLLLSITPSPTIAPDVTVTPLNMPTPVVLQTQGPTPSPTPRRFGWEILFDKPSYTSADVSGSQYPEFTGVMKSPLTNNSTICFADDQKFFAFKKDATTLGRLCDEFTPTPSQRTLNCYKYNADTGIQVAAKIYPYSSCNGTAPPIMSGTYVMAVRVYYNCKLPGGSMSGIPVSSCTDTREVFSYDLIYTH